MGYTLYWRLRGLEESDHDIKYIKIMYPEIWKRIYPRGHTMHQNPFAHMLFIRGKYDDGTDERLNEIKFKIKLYQNLVGWPFLLTIVIWLFNVALMVLCGWFGR
jgi:hypothetical protein